MSLSTAFNTARSSLLGTQTQMSVVSRNTAGASDPYYSRKIASVVTEAGAVRVSVARASDIALYKKVLTASSGVMEQQSIMLGLDNLNATIGDTEHGNSPSSLLGKMRTALTQFSQAPENTTLAKTFLNSAAELVSNLNKASETTQKTRQAADTAIDNSVARVNELLGKFGGLNQEVMRGIALGSDVSDALDSRDALISQISEELGVQVLQRENGDIALYTDSGVPLFDQSARTVTFTRTNSFSPGSSGGAVFVDGVPVTGPGSPMPLQSGSIVGHAAVRDELSVAYQSQLDELARGLVDAFKEVDQSGGGLPDMAGIFSIMGSSAVPGSPTAAGLAARLQINPDLLGQPDGGLAALRDGGVNGAAYRYNPAAAGSDSAFSGRLEGLMGEVEANRPIDASLGFGATQSLIGIANASAGWLQSQRVDTNARQTYAEAVLTQASASLSNATGVNIDDETAKMIQLEQSYSASAKLIATINDMMKSLMAMV
jgi:flagellar hook-associated protein 1 FlgK